MAKWRARNATQANSHSIPQRRANYVLMAHSPAVLGLAVRYVQLARRTLILTQRQLAPTVLPDDTLCQLQPFAVSAQAVVLTLTELPPPCARRVPPVVSQLLGQRSAVVVRLERPIPTEIHRQRASNVAQVRLRVLDPFPVIDVPEGRTMMTTTHPLCVSRYRLRRLGLFECLVPCRAGLSRRI